MIAMPSAVPSKLMNTGRFRNGIICVTIMKAPAVSPAPPTPATARPAINTADVAAVATINEPKRKSASEIMYILLIENRWYILPTANCNPLTHSL